jgi:hypothetical protein
MAVAPAERITPVVTVLAWGGTHGTAARGHAAATQPVARPAARLLRRELMWRRDADFVARAHLKRHNAAAIRQWVRVTDDNTEWIRAVVDEMGLPGYSLVGRKATDAAVLLVEHSDRDLEFQRRCLILLQEAVSFGEASVANFAHLTDRVLLGDGHMQIYGTQLNAGHGRYEAPRLRDPKTVDLRRAAVGLDHLEQSVTLALQQFGPPEPFRIPCCNCGSSLEAWLPEMGGNWIIRCNTCGFPTTLRARINSHRSVRAKPGGGDAITLAGPRTGEH